MPATFMTWVGLRIAFLVVVAVAAGAAAPARAADDPERRARAHFAVGEYREALKIYGDLYADTLHPTYLRNIGRCYQMLGEADRAINSFHEYLRKAKDLKPEQRAEVGG